MHLTYLRDKSMSPLTYGGAGISGAFSFVSNGPSKHLDYQFRHDRGTLRNAAGTTSSYMRFSFKNHTLYGEKGDEGTPFRWGWSNNNVLASYTHSTYGNFGSRSYYFTSFGAAASYTHDFSVWGVTFRAAVVADVQLLGFTLRPSYVSGNPEGYLDPSLSGIQAFLQSVELFVPGKAWNVGMQPQLTYTLGSGNALSLSYQFEYSRIQHPETVTESMGNWFLTLITAL